VQPIPLDQDIRGAVAPSNAGCLAPRCPQPCDRHGGHRVEVHHQRPGIAVSPEVQGLVRTAHYQASLWRHWTTRLDGERFILHSFRSLEHLCWVYSIFVDTSPAYLAPVAGKGGHLFRRIAQRTKIPDGATG
jgi:hypothetical protein